MGHNMKPRPLPRLPSLTEEERQRLTTLAEKAVYRGSPLHKRNPGDFGLTPPCSPRTGKSLCDAAGVCCQGEAARLLKEGLRRGLVSETHVNGWPKAVWAVLSDNIVLEARLDDAERGSYHGYPLAPSDPLISEVVQRWKKGA